MTRPFCCRRVSCEPAVTLFKPSGVDMTGGDPIVLTLDEFEAIRLADRIGCYQEEGARSMEVSRATFGRILASARAKVAEAIVEGIVLRIEGGPVQTMGDRRFVCSACSHEWRMGFSKKRPATCPQCQCDQIRKTTCIDGCKGDDAMPCCNKPPPGSDTE